MTKYIILLILTAFSISYSEFEQNGFSYDYSWFKTDDQKIELEFYYSFPNTFVTYQYDSAGYISESTMSIEFYDSNVLVGSDSWDIVLSSDVQEPSYQMDILGQNDFILVPGNYTIKLQLFDSNSSILYSKSFDLNLAEFESDRPSISGIQFAQVIESASKPSSNWNPAFLKDGYFVIPNPYMEFRGDSLHLQPYFEIYNTKSFKADKLTVKYRIIDAARRQVAVDQIEQEINSDKITIFKRFPLYKLPAGVYYFEASIIYEKEEVKDSTSVTKKFFSYNWSKEPSLDVSYSESELFQASEFATMDDYKVAEEYKQLKFILNGFEKQEYSLLTTQKAKQRALYKYWKLRDTDSLPTLNLRREKFKESIQFADLHFRSSNYPTGWETDRGRVLLKYGSPISRDRYPPKFDKHGTEIWYYEGQMAGSFFVFVDERGTNDYKLVHSTYPSEIYNDRWVEYYRPAIDDEELNQDMFKPKNEEQY